MASDHDPIRSETWIRIMIAEDDDKSLRESYDLAESLGGWINFINDPTWGANDPHRVYLVVPTDISIQAAEAIVARGWYVDPDPDPDTSSVH